MTVAVGNKTELTPASPLSGTIVLAAQAWIVVFYRTATATGVAASSDIDGGFGSAVLANGTNDGFQFYAFAKYCSAGTHTITVSGTGLSLNAGELVEVTGTSGASALDKFVGRFQDFQTAPTTGSTGALSAAPALALALCFTTSNGNQPAHDSGGGWSNEGNLWGDSWPANMQSKRVTVTTAIDAGWTVSLDDTTQGVLVFTEGSGAATPDVPVPPGNTMFFAGSF